jgi:hypothetical protein
MTLADQGLWKDAPAAADIAVADFTPADITTSTPICYPAATIGVGNLPTSVTNGQLNDCGQALPAGATCTYNCSSAYTKNAVTTFSCSSVGTVAYVSPNAGNMTCTAPVAQVASAGASNTQATNCSYGESSTCATRVTQVIVISSLTVAAYVTNTKSTYECAYAKMVSNSWCTPTTGATAYRAGVKVASLAAARRSATITFTMDVENDVMVAALVQTAVRENVSGANLITQLTAVNAATTWGVTLPALADIDVQTPTFTGAATSSAAVVIPSALMVLLGSLISLFWN